jgi:hypothetical protein
MKTSGVLFFLFYLLGCASMAQKTIRPTDSLFIKGNIERTVVYSLADLDTFPQVHIDDQIVYNHNGIAKDTLTGLHGISVKALLSSVQYLDDSPKQLNESYFVFTASDGYRIVFSWNEIYSTDVGNHLFILTEMEGHSLKEIAQRIYLISAADIRTGRRFVKSLQYIEIRKLQ